MRFVNDAQRRAVFAKGFPVGFPKVPRMQDMLERGNTIIGPYEDVDRLNVIIEGMSRSDSEFEKLFKPIRRVYIIDYKAPTKAEAISSEEIAISQKVLRKTPDQVPGQIYHELYHVYNDRLKRGTGTSKISDPNEIAADKWANERVDKLNEYDAKHRRCKK